MKLHWSNSNKRWKDSITVSLAILTTLQAIAEVAGFFDIPVINDIPWWSKLLYILGIFIILVLSSFIIKGIIAKRGLTLMVGDNKFIVKKADVFDQKGLKVIPFNERFDTKVDDKIIAHTSLNGILIDKYFKDKNKLNSLKNTIKNSSEIEELHSYNDGNFKKYPLGRIIQYDDFLLLAFTHIDNENRAYLSHIDYEQCLLNMWKELDRVNAGLPIFIPLLGSGITRFRNTPHKSKFSLLHCLICTLKMSGIQLKEPITLCLTEDAMEEINIYELKKYSKQ